MAEVIGFIGVGAIGSLMACRLAGGGARVLAHDRNAEAVIRLRSAGIEPAPSPRALGDGAEIVFLCMPNLDAGRDVMLGRDGLIGGKTVRVVVDLSTTGSAFAEEMASAARERGVVYMASPVTGGLPGAAAGTLAVMTSGPRDVFDDIKPYLDRIGSNVFYVGPGPGDAQLMKLINNILSSTSFVMTCQAFVFGTKAGLDPDLMVQVINSGTGRNSATTGKVPKGILPRTFDYGAKNFITAKDSALCIEEADAMGVDLSVAKAAQRLWRHVMDKGGADDDNTTIIKYLEEPAGVVVSGRAAAENGRADAARDEAVGEDRWFRG